MQDLGDMESVFGDTHMNFKTVYSMIATRPVKIINSVFQGNVQVAEELRERGSRC